MIIVNLINKENTQIRKSYKISKMVMKCKKCGHSYEDHANVYDANGYGETNQDTGCYECVCERFVKAS